MVVKILNSLYVICAMGLALGCAEFQEHPEMNANSDMGSSEDSNTDEGTDSTTVPRNDTGADTDLDTQLDTSPDTDGNTGDGETQKVTFLPDDTTDFLNPERGWMRRGNEDIFDDARAGNDDHQTGYSVVWTDVGSPAWDGDSGNPFRLDNYRKRNLPSSLLDALGDVFAAARREGIKLKVRFAYNYSSGGRDTTKEWMLTHIGQLGPVLTENADAIASLDAGFIGYWGEMHSSTDIVRDGGDEAGAIAEVVNALLAETPAWLNVDVRYPRIVRSLFGDPGYDMDLGERFSGTDQARVGWYNDCLWSNKGNTGTYGGGDGFERDRDTFEKIGRYAATSGESCNAGGLNEYNSCDAVLEDMAKIGGPDTLFRGFWKDMYDRWIEEGCYKEISLRLGYRLLFVSATLPVQVSAGEPFTVSLELQNSGFGKVYNPRPVDLVFVGADGAATTRLTPDARKKLPLAGETVTASWTVEAPADLRSGQRYQLYLRLPDPSARLEPDNRFAIRMANSGEIWDPTTGRHDLGASVDAE